MGFVDDDGKGMVYMFLSDFLRNIRELLYCGHNDPLAVLDGLFQVARVLGPYDGILYLHELFNRIPDLLVQNPPSVTTMTESIIGRPSCSSPIS